MTARVLVDALAARPGGGLSYLLRQLPALERVAPDLQVSVLASDTTAPVLRASMGCDVEALRFRSRTARIVWEQTVLPARSRGSVLYCPGNVVPLAAARRSVLVLQNPNYFGAGRTLPHNRTVTRRLEAAGCHASVRRAARVLAISESLRTDVEHDVAGRRANVEVLHSGAPAWDESPRRPAGLDPSLAGQGASPPLVSLANDAPHKALDVLVGGWAAARSKGLAAPLLLIGDVAPQRVAQLRRLASCDGLHLMGPVHDRGELRWLLEHAAAMVATSLLEAHPLTPAEAGALGCPLVLSDIPPHREVAGEHALFVPPGAIDALASALLALPAERVPKPWTWPVTWDENAAQLAEVLREVARELALC